MEQKLEKLDEKLRSIELDVHIAKSKLENITGNESRISDLEKRLDTYDRLKWFAIAIAVFFGVSGGYGWQQLDLAYGKIDELETRSTELEAQFVALETKAREAMRSIEVAEEEGIRRITTAATEARESHIEDIEARISSLQAEFSPSSDITSKDLESALKRVDALESGLKNGDFYIKTRGLTVLNDQGDSIISLFSRTDDNGEIQVKNSLGQNVVALAATGSNIGLVRTLNADGVAMVDLYNTDNGGYVNVMNNAGKRVLSLNTRTDGKGAMNVYNGEGTLLVAIAATASDSGLVRVLHAEGKMTGDLYTDGDGGVVLLSDENGKHAVSVAPKTSGSGSLALYSRDGGEHKVLQP